MALRSPQEASTGPMPVKPEVTTCRLCGAYGQIQPGTAGVSIFVPLLGPATVPKRMVDTWVPDHLFQAYEAASTRQRLGMLMTLLRVLERTMSFLGCSLARRKWSPEEDRNIRSALLEMGKVLDSTPLDYPRGSKCGTDLARPGEQPSGEPVRLASGHQVIRRKRQKVGVTS